MDITTITIKKEDYPEIRDITTDTSVSVSILEAVKQLRIKKPNWRYRFGNIACVNVYQDAERIGIIEIETKYTRNAGNVSKFKISSHNIRKTKGDNSKRTNHVNGAVYIAANEFRGRTPEELINQYRGELTSAAMSTSIQADYKIKELVSNNFDCIKETLVNSEITKEFLALSGQVKKWNENLKEAQISEKSKLNSAVFIFRRISGWQVITSDYQSNTYKEFKDIPAEIGGKLAVMTILEDRNKYVPNVGMKCNGRIFWVLI